MADRILKFGGVGALSANERPAGEAEPDEDPRGRLGTEIVRGLHLVSAAEQLEPATTAGMAYFDPDAPDLDLDEIEEAVQDGRLSLSDVMTKTDRFTPLVNPRRSRLKSRGEMSGDSDADLWHVPTNNYRAKPPRHVFGQMARVIDNNDSIDNEGVYGEFRERRNGGEVYGNVWFDDFDVGAIDGDPVRLGMKFRWNYFGDLSFSWRPFAQQTRCQNSVAPLDDWQPVMAHNRSVDWREEWEEAIRGLGVYGDHLSQQIMAARDILFEFAGGFEEFEESDTDDDDIISIPMGLEAFYRHLDLPDPQIPADHAREEANASGDDRESSSRINAWHVHAGVTYWLAWHWNGSENSRAFREYRRTANDLLFNPHQITGRVRESYEQEERAKVVREVLGKGRPLDDADPDERAEIEERLNDHKGIATIAASTETLGDMVEDFEDTEERLDRIQDAMAEQ